MIENLKEYLEGALIVFKGGNISNIRPNAFKGMTTLTTIELTGSSTKLDNVNAFDGCTSLVHIYVPEEYVDTYKNADNWSAFSSLIEKKPPYNRVGGRIFYIDNSVTGAEYTFYDSNENIITDQSSIQSLQNAYYYTKTGDNENNKDRFYVADIANSSAIKKYNDSGNKYIVWSTEAEDLSIHSDELEVLSNASYSIIGKGKSNTAWIATYKDNNKYYPNKYGENDISCWDFCSSCNSNSLNDCNDWFVPNIAEINQMRQSGIWGTKGTKEGITTWLNYTKYNGLSESYVYSSSASLDNSRAFSWLANPTQLVDQTVIEWRYKYNYFVTTVARSF